MMKLLLTSTGLANQNIATPFDENDVNVVTLIDNQALLIIGGKTKIVE